ncbi:NUDIX hydrolase domain-like protein [Obelidium mucronatum]|nr:NUDIX hydrolase domain-like protein [Obelidium mucronatum]
MPTPPYHKISGHIQAPKRNAPKNPPQMQESRTGRDKQVYTAAGLRKVVGVVPVLPDGRIVLVTSSKRRSDWVLPKGGAETDETLAAAAAREAFEEAGLRGSVGARLVSFVNAKATAALDFFVMRGAALADAWPEQAHRDRRAFAPDEALARLREHGRNQLYKALEAYLALESGEEQMSDVLDSAAESAPIATGSDTIA